MASTSAADHGIGTAAIDEAAHIGEAAITAADTETAGTRTVAGAEASAGVNKGLTWLVHKVESGGLFDPAPIGFYFAKLWYYEKLYPIIFTVAALGRARNKRSRRDLMTHPDRLP